MRAIQPRSRPSAQGAPAPDPAWLTTFLAELARTDVAPATRRGYGYDLRHFLAWHASVQNGGFALARLGEYDLIAYRQHRICRLSMHSAFSGQSQESTGS